MRRIYWFAFALLVLLPGCEKTMELNANEDPNVIFYTTTDHELLDLGNSFNAADIESHTYGRIRFYNPVKEIPEETFGDCSVLFSISMPHGVESIGNGAFSGCDALTQVTMPNSVTSIGYGAFDGCSALTDVYYIGELAEWCGIRFDGFTANPLYYAHNLYIGNTLVTELVIPEGVTEIKDHAFSFYDALTQVTIGSSVTSIGNQAFYGCSALTQVDIPGSVESIGNSAFAYCSALTQVNIPGSVESIGNSTFGHCTQLETVFCKSENPPTLGRSAFDDTNLKTIYVPRNSVQAYKNEWYDYKDEIVGYDF